MLREQWIEKDVEGTSYDLILGTIPEFDSGE
jgi:hypothetical protein